MEVTNLSFIMIDWCLTPALAVFQQYHDVAIFSIQGHNSITIKGIKTKFEHNLW